MLTREEVRGLALEGKDRLGLTWQQVGEAIGRSPVYAAMLVYGYGQADGLVRALALPEGAKAPHREPAQPWPPTSRTSPTDGIMSAIDMLVEVRKTEDQPGVPRMTLTLNGKWLQYKKF